MHVLIQTQKSNKLAPHPPPGRNTRMDSRTRAILAYVAGREDPLTPIDARVILAAQPRDLLDVARLIGHDAMPGLAGSARRESVSEGSRARLKRRRVNAPVIATDDEAEPDTSGDDTVVGTDFIIQDESDTPHEDDPTHTTDDDGRVDATCVGKIYTVVCGEDGAIGYFRLDKWNGNETHNITWLYTWKNVQEQSADVEIDSAISRAVHRVEKIHQVPLFTSIHRDTLEVGGWTDVNDHVFSTVIPPRLTGAQPYTMAFLLGYYDIDANTISVETDCDTWIDMLLSIGKDGGQHLKKIIKSATAVQLVPDRKPASGICDACGLERTLSYRVNVHHRATRLRTTMKMGQFCAHKVKAAHDLVLCTPKTDREKYDELVAAAMAAHVAFSTRHS